MVPVEGKLIAAGPMPADTGAVALLIAALAFGLREPGFGGRRPPQREQTVGQALAKPGPTPAFCC
jgi:hypothetical protein